MRKDITGLQDIKVPEMRGLEFKDETHTYILDGVQIPSVSAIMEPLSNFEYGKIDRKTLDKAAEKGTAVHNAIENWLKFEIVDIDEDYINYFNAFLRWWEERRPVLVGSEIRMYHKLMRYAGTVDLLAIIDGELNLVDFKTTYKCLEKNCGVQLEAYSQGLRSHGVRVNRKRILHLAKDGKWDELNFPEADADRWRVFGSLKTVYDYTRS